MLEWYAYCLDFNNRKIVPINVFEHGGLWADCIKNKKKNKDREAFVEQLRKDLMYYYWSKCEWEVIISDWPPSPRQPVEEKIDVYDQVMLNWKAFADYVWEHRGEIK